MTTTESWSRADTRDMNLYQFFADISGHKFYDNTNFSFQGKTYQDTIDYTYDYNGRYYAFSVIGSGFAVNSKGVLTGGTVNGTVSWSWDTTTSKWYYDAFIKDYAIAATAFFAPYLTVSRTDDHASFRQVLSGNDHRVYHDFNDYGYAGAGNDTLQGGGGSDSLFGDDGNDLLEGGSGNDLLRGGAGFDRIVGGTGNDHAVGDTGNDIIIGGEANDIVEGGNGLDSLYGAKGNDRLEGGFGNDTLTGNSGSDVFLFRAHHGLDHITDFQDGMDRVKVLLTAGTDLNLKLKYVGGDVVATFLDVTLVFDDVRPGSITAADFSTLLI